jgi:HlyD family secretion protein
MRRWVIRLVLCGTALAGGGVVLASRTPPPGPTPIAAAPRIPVALGRIEPASEVITLAVPQGNRSARIAAILVRQGDAIAAGQALAVMDNAETLAAQLRQAEVTLAQREARLAQRLVELEVEEASLAAALDQERATRDRAKWEHERITRLERGGVYRETAIIDKRLALDAAEQRVVSAELALDRARRRDAGGQRLEERVLRSEAAVAEAAVAQMRAELALATLRGPIDGTVLRVNARPGEVPDSGEGVMLLGDLRRMHVRVEVFESDVAGIAPGRPVRITGRALTGDLAGEVAWVGLRVARQTLVREDPAATLDARMVEVMVALDAPSSRAAAGLTGMQVRAFFEAAR